MILSKAFLLSLLTLWSLLACLSARQLERASTDSQLDQGGSVPQICDSHDDECLAKPSVNDVITNSLTLTFLEQFLVAGRMTGWGGFPSTTTYFLPWDKAFDRLPRDWKERLKHPMWRAHLRDFLHNHVYEGSLPLESIAGNHSITMKNGQDIAVSKEGKRVVFNSIRHLANMEVVNGYAYMMDDVFLPSFMSQTALAIPHYPQISTWVRYVHLAHLEKALTNPSLVATIIAPCDDAWSTVSESTRAFWELPEGREDLRNTLLRHIVPRIIYTTDSLLMGATTSDTLLEGHPAVFYRTHADLSISGSFATDADVLLETGVMHIIDQVLLPTAELSVQMDGTSQAAARRMMV
jgi:uncharacterized surface protein with fasciclin (FAS1) repeats